MWIRDGLDRHYTSHTTDNYQYTTNNGRNIHILYVTDLDVGYYECSGTTRNGDRFLARALLKLIGICNTVKTISPTFYRYSNCYHYRPF